MSGATLAGVSICDSRVPLENTEAFPKRIHADHLLTRGVLKMDVSYQVSELADMGNRRSRIDRRSFTYSCHIPERRRGGDRRSGIDRRSAAAGIGDPVFRYENHATSLPSLQ